MPLKPVDTAIKVIVGPLIDDSDFKTREEAVAHDAAGMEIDAIIEKSDGTIAKTSITPTTGGDYDWAHIDQGYYELALPASGGASFNNTEHGTLTLVGHATGVLPFRSPSYDIVPQNVYNSLIAGSDNLETDTVSLDGDAQSLDDLKDFADSGYDPGTHKVQGLHDDYDPAKTASQPGDPMTLTASERNSVADAVLGRDVSNVEAAAAEHTLCTIVLATLESSIDDTDWTIRRTDGSTTHASKTVTANAAANPITGVN